MGRRTVTSDDVKQSTGDSVAESRRNAKVQVRISFRLRIAIPCSDRRLRLLDIAKTPSSTMQSTRRQLAFAVRLARQDRDRYSPSIST